MDRIDPEFDEYVQRAWNNPSILIELVEKDRRILGLRGLHEETLLHFFAVESKVEAVRILLKLGSDPNCVNRLGTTPLIDAATLGECPTMRLLLEKGAKVDQRDKHGSTALHRAAEFEKREAYKLLVEAGADENIVNMLGETPLSLLAEHS